MELTEKQKLFNLVKKYGLKLILEEVALIHIELKVMKNEKK